MPACQPRLALQPPATAASIRAPMRPVPHLSTLRAAACLVLAGLGTLVSGCGHKVGDSCKANVDCSALGDRFCDVAAPGGYCTIEGCDVRLNEKSEVVDSC